MLKRRISGLDLSIRGTPVARALRRLHRELAARGIAARPRAWVALEWFSPDGVPGIAVPFYLLHPRLRALQRRFMGEAEGSNARELMRILRHEAGHAIDTAFRLRRRAGWRAAFGPASRRYPRSYRPRPGSRRYVQHLAGWYAQSHPAEDFAETFAVWLTPGSDWRRRYAGWPAMRKLRYVAALMRELRGRPPLLRAPRVVEPLRESRLTLGRHYRRLARRGRGASAPRTDAALTRLFAPAGGRRRRTGAARMIREELPHIRRRVARRLDVSEYLVGEVAKRMIARSRALGLQLRGTRRAARAAFERVLAAEVARSMRQFGPRLSL
ncbi:MAG: putative zinc-binding metallopeptidase [Gammaproteobacteria bacterium]